MTNEEWSMAEMDDLIHDLRKRIAGEVRFDPMTKVLYSTDASIYEIEPLGVVIRTGASSDDLDE